MHSLIIFAFCSIACVAWLASAQLRSSSRAASPEVGGAPAARQKIDINSASLEDLCRLPGIVRETGEKIIRHRPYRRLDDLVVRKVLSKKQFARVREYVRVGTVR